MLRNTKSVPAVSVMKGGSHQLGVPVGASSLWWLQLWSSILWLVPWGCTRWRRLPGLACLLVPVRSSRLLWTRWSDRPSTPLGWLCHAPLVQCILHFLLGLGLSSCFGGRSLCSCHSSFATCPSPVPATYASPAILRACSSSISSGMVSWSTLYNQYSMLCKGISLT